MINNSFDKRNVCPDDENILYDEKGDFEKIKEFYYGNFKNDKSLNVVIETYINITSDDKLFDDTRLKILCMYFSNKYTISEICNCIKWKLNINIKITNVEEYINLDANIYDNIKNAISPYVKIQKQFGDVSINQVLIILAFRYTYEAIIKENYLNIIYYVIKEKEIDLNIKEFNQLKKSAKNLLKLNNIHYWDSFSEKWNSCNALINERYIGIKFLNGESTIFSVGKKGLIKIKISKLTSDYKITFDFDEDIWVNQDSKDLIVEYYNNFNKMAQNEIEEDIKTINTYMKNLPPNIIELVIGYLDYCPKNFLLDKDDYMAFQHIVSFDDYYTNCICEINEQQREIVEKRLRNNKEFYNSLLLFKKESYLKFVKIIGKYLNSEKRFHSSITFLLIKKYSPKYFFDIWNKKYGRYFSDKSIKSLNQFVHTYCRIDEINPKDVRNAGAFTYYLIYQNKFIDVSNNDFLKCNVELIKLILEECKKIELERFESKLINHNYRKIVHTIDEVDLMNGYEFENFICELFKKMGFSAKVTKSSGDQGIDILLEKNGDRIGVQAKCYSCTVGNKAIQEVVGGLKYYNCYKGIVVTNNYFTDSAKELAEVNNVVLWDRNMVKQKIEDVLNRD